LLFVAPPLFDMRVNKDLNGVGAIVKNYLIIAFGVVGGAVSLVITIDSIIHPTKQAAHCTG
jgi:hypothetical protein